MPTSSELVKRKREAEAWEAQMASLRAQSVAAPGQQQVAPVDEKPAPVLGPGGQPAAKGSTDG